MIFGGDVPASGCSAIGKIVYEMPPPAQTARPRPHPPPLTSTGSAPSHRPLRTDLPRQPTHAVDTASSPPFPPTPHHHLHFRPRRTTSAISAHAASTRTLLTHPRPARALPLTHPPPIAEFHLHPHLSGLPRRGERDGRERGGLLM